MDRTTNWNEITNEIFNIFIDLSNVNNDRFNKNSEKTTETITSARLLPQFCRGKTNE